MISHDFYSLSSSFSSSSSLSSSSSSSSSLLSSSSSSSSYSNSLSSTTPCIGRLPRNEVGRLPRNEGKFPEKLYSILADEGVHSIAWFEDGSGFCIIDPPAFESNVISKYFSRKRLFYYDDVDHLKISRSLLERKIRSFFRQLNTYGFVKSSETSWRKKYSFSHPLFQRGLPHLLGRMQRRKPSFHRKTAKDKRRTARDGSDHTLSHESSTTPDVPSSTVSSVSNANQTSLSSMSDDTSSCCSLATNSSNNDVSSSTVTIPCMIHHDRLSTEWMNEEGPSYEFDFTDQEIIFLKELLGMDSQ